jgi:hypothetical protein
MNRFSTLLQREWMQHRLGWLVMLGAPLLICLVAAMFGGVSVNLGNGDTKVERVPEALLLAFGSMGAMIGLTLSLACLFALFQAPGLARRDHQDRSIEFWLSLPVGHVQSLSATLLAHLLLLPWAALAVGAVGGLVLTPFVVVKAWGVGAWVGLPWGSLVLAMLALVLRLAVGLALALLWLSPLILLTMAASAWLKRWGVPLVAAVLGIGGLVLEKVYQQTIVWDVLGYLTGSAGQALVSAERSGRGMVIDARGDILPMVQNLPTWALKDLGLALQDLASPGFVGALLFGAVGFGLLILRRQRGS